jgi:hypothetical protein
MAVTTASCRTAGRDSTFTLHVVKRVLGLNPWHYVRLGMVNDLARRNIARVCGKLGVENIIVSADVRWKRENIRKNVLAWLSRPHLGMGRCSWPATSSSSITPTR